MTRTELLQLIIAKARSQGFQLRRWYVARLEREWTGAEAAILVLAAQRRYYALLFSHDFAKHFWKPGEEMTLMVPEREFTRVRKDGSTSTVVRKGYMRRRVRKDAWRFHLRQMVLEEEPLRYVRKFIRVVEELELKPERSEPPIVIVDEEDLLPEDDD